MQIAGAGWLGAGRLDAGLNLSLRSPLILPAGCPESTTCLVMAEFPESKAKPSHAFETLSLNWQADTTASFFQAEQDTGRDQQIEGEGTQAAGNPGGLVDSKGGPWGPLPSLPQARCWLSDDVGRVRRGRGGTFSQP